MEQALWSRLVVPIVPVWIQNLSRYSSQWVCARCLPSIRSYIKDVVAYCKKHKELVKIPVCSVLWMVNNHKKNTICLPNQGSENAKRTFFCFPSLGKTSTVQSGISTLSTSKTWRAEGSRMKRWKNILKEPRHQFLHHFPHLILSDVHII